MSRALKVQDRGGFFDDPFFQDSWNDFDSAVQRVFERFDDPSNIHRSSSSSSHSSLGRERRVAEEPYASQALQVVEKDGRFEVVMDVQDFNPRNLQVRAVEDNRIVVEGKYEQMAEDGISSSWKTFSKEFTLPDEADFDLVTTALSKDGILTVKAPKKATPVISTAKPKSNTVQSVNESYDEQMNADGHSMRSFKSTSSSTASTASSFKSNGSKTLQSSSSFESCDSGLDSLPRDVKDRLMVNESCMSSVSNSNSSCSSPVPSEAPSDVSRVSTTMEFEVGDDLNKNTSKQRSEVTFNVKAAEKNRLSETNERPGSQASTEHVFPTESRNSTPSKFDRMSLDKSEMYPPSNPSPVFMPPATRVPIFTPGCGSVGDRTVTVEEKDGRRTVKAERSNVIQEKDGLMESHEITAEVDEKDGQSARREAVTRIQRLNDDPSGRFKGAEKAEASDVSESCVKVLPDGSKMSIKKSSTSTSSHKTFSSMGNSVDAFDDPFFNVGFNSDFGDLRSLMGRGHSLMSQMSTDSMGSTLSGRSSASDRSHVSNQSRMSSSSDTSRHSNASSRSQFSNESSQSKRSTSFDRTNRLGEEFPDRSSSLRDQFGISDRESVFSNRSLFSNRPSLSERFPSFSDSLAEFDDMQRDFSNFPSMSSRMSSRSSNMSNNSFSSFGSHFDDKF